MKPDRQTGKQSTAPLLHLSTQPLAHRQPKIKNALKHSTAITQNKKKQRNIKSIVFR